MPTLVSSKIFTSNVKKKIWSFPDPHNQKKGLSAQIGERSTAQISGLQPQPPPTTTTDKHKSQTKHVSVTAQQNVPMNLQEIPPTVPPPPPPPPQMQPFQNDDERRLKKTKRKMALAF